MAKKFLTLNIGASTVELAAYEQGAKGALTLVHYGTATLSASLEGGAAETILAPALLEIVRTTGIKPGPVALSISGQMAFQRFAMIPPVGSGEKFEQLVRYEIEQNVPFPIDEMVCDRQITGDAENGDKSVLIVSAKIDQVEELTSAIASVGFVPELVDVAPLALTNAVLYATEDAESCSVLLDIGAKTTSLVIVEGEKIYNRSIPVAGQAITREIATALGCSLEEAEKLKCERGYVSMGGVTEDEDETVDRIAKSCRAVLTRLNAEISRSINFYRSQQGGGVPTHLYLTGGSALLPQIDSFFAESLGIDVSFFNPFERMTVGAKVDTAALEADGALLAPTAGLALHLAGLARYAINLLPPSLVSERAEKARIPFLIAAGLSFILALTLVMLATNHDTDVLLAQRDAVQQKVSRLESFDKKVASAAAAVQTEQAAADDLGSRLARRSFVLQAFHAVRQSLMPGMWIEKWEEGRVTLRYWKDRTKTDGVKTVGERVVENLKGKNVVIPESVKIADMSVLGKEAQVEQVTIELKFRNFEPESATRTAGL